MTNKRYPQKILVSCEIPWSEKEELIEDTFRQEIQNTINNGYKNMYIFGTAGEGYAVKIDQFKEIVQVFKEETINTKQNIEPMVGVIGLSTSLVTEKIAIAYDSGFRMFQISLPSWGELNNHEYMNFFKDVCGSFNDCSFLNYNLPRTKRILLSDDYKRIQDSVPNLVATKFTSASAEECEKLVKETEIQHFFGDNNFPSGILHGECSLLSASASLMPKKVRQFFDLGKNKEFGELSKLLRKMNKSIDTLFGSAKHLNLIDGAYDKVIKRASGIDMPLKMLSPYQSVPLEIFEKSYAEFQQKFGHWAE